MLRCISSRINSFSFPIVCQDSNRTEIEVVLVGKCSFKKKKKMSLDLIMRGGHEGTGALRSQKRMSDPLELELHVVVRCWK